MLICNLYYSTIFFLSLSALLSSQSVKQGDPVTITIQRGSNNIAVFFFNDARSSRIYLTQYGAVYDADAVLIPPSLSLP
jgi:hypothetical protein